MGLKEAFEMVVNTINTKFKEGLYDINEANSIISSINIIGKALSTETPAPDTKQEVVEEYDMSTPVKKTSKK